MDITFFVGNGFDLSMGYKTSYPDFYEWYLERPTPPEHSQIIGILKQSIKDDIKNGLVNWSDFEIGFGKFTKLFKTDEVDGCVEVYEDVVQNLNTYLSGIPVGNVIEEISEKQCDEIRKNLYSFYLDGTEDERILFSGLKRDEHNNGRESVFHFVSFNYTPFLDVFAKKISPKPFETWKHGSAEKKDSLDPNVFHVHGLLSDYPIVGVSNEDQILNTEFRKDDYLCATLIKSKSIRAIGRRRYSTLEKTINKSRIICLWGLSLGASDHHWWKAVNQWLKDDENRHLFIFWYTDDPPQGTLVSEHYRKQRNVVNGLLKYSDFPKDVRERLRQRIHVIFNTPRVLKIPRPLIANRS